MYTKDHDHAVEDICYKIAHMEQILKTIKANFPKHFEMFLRSRESDKSKEYIDELLDRFMVNDSGKHLVFDAKIAFVELMRMAENDFESDRKSYIELFDDESLEEYDEDRQLFKSKALAIDSPIIRKTLQNVNAPALDKFRHDFWKSNANELLTKVKTLAEFAKNYSEHIYDPAHYDEIVLYQDFHFDELDSEKYTVRGVIGGGIRSAFLYKNYPEIFPYRSRLSLWHYGFWSTNKLSGVTWIPNF